MKTKKLLIAKNAKCTTKYVQGVPKWGVGVVVHLSGINLGIFHVFCVLFALPLGKAFLLKLVRAAKSNLVQTVPVEISIQNLGKLCQNYVYIKDV